MAGKKATFVIELQAKIEGFLGSLGQVGKEADKLGGKLQKIGKKVTRVGEDLTKTFTLPIAAGFTAAIKETSDFESAMAKVSAVTQASAEDTEKLEKVIRDLSQSTQYTASETADAAYYMGMAGWDAEQILAGLPAVLNLATASGEDLATTSDIVTDALTAFGLKAEDAGHFTDVLAETSRSANTNVSLLGESFQYAAPVAGALGYSVEDVALALGLMANNGVKGSQAGTSLRNVFQRMAKPTKESATAMEQLGISLQDDSGRMYSFGEVMDQLRRSMGDLATPSKEVQMQISDLNTQLEDGTISEEEYQESLESLIGAVNGTAAAEKTRLASMLGGARAMPGLLAIVNSAEEDYNGLADAIGNSEGVAQGMAETMNNTLAGQFKILVSQLQELARQFGEILLPVVKDVVAWLQGMVTKLQEMDPETKEMILKIAGIVAAIGPLLIIGGKLTTGIGGLMKGGGSLVKFLAALPGWVLPVAAAIGAVAAVIITLWNDSEEFRNAVTDIWNDLKETWEECTQEIVDLLNEMGFDFKDIGEVISAAWHALCDILGPVLITAFKGVVSALKNAIQLITGIVKAFLQLLKGDWKGAFQTLSQTATSILSNIFNSFRDKFEGIWNFVSKIIEKLKNIFDFDWSLPKIKLPHFNVDRYGGAEVLGIRLPKITVDWYKKAYDNPYLFTSPTVINGKGFGDGGGSGEIVYGRDQLMRDIAAASTGNVTINVYASEGMNVNQLADKIQARLAQVQKQRMSAYA